MSDVFISYNKEDRDRASDLASRLEKEGWAVFWDRTIPIGSTWDDMLERELISMKVMVVLWSAASVASEWVRAEAEEGAARRILVPAFLEPVKLPIRFRPLQAADICDWTASQPDTPGLRQLIDAIARIGGFKSREEADAEKDKLAKANAAGLEAESQGTHRKDFEQKHTEEENSRRQAEARRRAEEDMIRRKAEAERKAVWDHVNRGQQGEKSEEGAVARTHDRSRTSAKEEDRANDCDEDGFRVVRALSDF